MANKLLQILNHKYLCFLNNYFCSALVFQHTQLRCVSNTINAPNPSLSYACPIIITAPLFERLLQVGCGGGGAESNFITVIVCIRKRLGTMDLRWMHSSYLTHRRINNTRHKCEQNIIGSKLVSPLSGHLNNN